ncbi:MAG TPA: DUF3617 family protein [Xanthobacteraceae bacterium]|jgi:hypothetical protein|nr:DUF3617 family protein [Xanthobacteraceae bacterium]
MNLAVLASQRAAALVMLVLLSAPFARADGLQPGLWRILTHPVIDGVAGREQENTRCLTPADVADPEKTFSPVGQTVNSTCEMVEHELTPGRLKWHLQCTGQLDMDLTGEFLFDAPEHYSATVTTAASMMGRLMQAGRMTVEGQRVGECQ